MNRKIGRKERSRKVKEENTEVKKKKTEKWRNKTEKELWMPSFFWMLRKYCQ